MDFSELNARWSVLKGACGKHCATGRWLEGNTCPPKFEIDPPASEADIAAIEGKLETKIPSSFRRVLLTYSARVCIEWQLPDRVQPPAPFHSIFGGECRWNLWELPELAETYKGWLTECFSDPDDPYGSIWYDKFPFLEVGNGDIVALDPTLECCEPVVYLSHDDGEGHGYWLGKDFEDYLDRLSRLGCPGSEDWQWIPFVSGDKPLLDPDSANAQAWRAWFGMEPFKAGGLTQH